MAGFDRKSGPDMVDLAAAEDVEIMIGHANQLWINIGGACLLRVGRCQKIRFDINDESPTMVEARQSQLESESLKVFEPIEDYIPDTDAGHFNDPTLDP